MNTLFKFSIILFCILSVSYQSVLSGISEKIKFADTTLAKELLSEEDEYTDSFGEFDLKSKVGSTDNVVLDDYFENARNQVVQWTDEEKESIFSSANAIDKRLKSLEINLNLPNEIIFVRTTSQEEGGAAGYTRANYIVLGPQFSMMPDSVKLRIVAHELFHVYSRHNRDVREKLYSIIGFNICEEIKLPPSVNDIKIANPDAPIFNTYTTIQKKDKEIPVSLIIYTKKEYAGGSFFQYVNLGLLRLDNEDGINVFLDEEGEPVIYPLNENLQIFEKIGRNTNYVIHPEEIMASNFETIFTGYKTLPNPEIVEEFIEVLKEDS